MALEPGWNSLQACSIHPFHLEMQDEEGLPLILESRPSRALLPPEWGDGEASSPWLLEVLDPKAPDAPLWRAYHLQRLGQPERAIAEMEPLRLEFPQSALLAWTRATCQGKDEDWELARPLCHAARLHRARREARRERPVETLQSLAEARPDHLETQKALSLWQRGPEPETARQTLLRLVPLKRGTWFAILQLAQMGYRAEAEALLDQEQGWPPLQRMQARLRLLDPGACPIMVDFLDSGQVEQACQLTEELSRVLPGGGEWNYQLMAQLHERAGRPERALACYRQACRYWPQNAGQRLRLAQAYRRHGEPVRAERTYRQALRLDPELIHLREVLRELRGERPLPEALVLALPFQAPWPVQPARKLYMRKVGFHDICDSHCPALVVIQDLREVLYPDGASLADYHLAARITGSGIFAWKPPRRTDAYPGTRPPPSDFAWKVKKALLYRSDGQVLDCLDLTQGCWATYHDCRPGDFFEARWRQESLGQGAYRRDWSFRGEHSRFCLVAPHHETFTVTAEEPIQAQPVRRVGDWQVLVWSASTDPQELPPELRVESGASESKPSACVG